MTENPILLETDFARLQQRKSPGVGEILFDPLRGFIYWPDERPSAVSSGAYELAMDLCIFRNFNFHISQCNIDDELLTRWVSLVEIDEIYGRQWSWAETNIPRWPGFSRLALSSQEKGILQAELTRWLEDGYPA